MTISTEAAQLSYPGNGTTVNFAITWRYILKSHVVAVLRSSAGVETTWVLNTNYTLTAANVDAGGTLTATTAPASGETLVISLEPPNTQTTSLPLGGAFPTASVEDALDVAAQRDSKTKNVLDRTLRVPKTDTQTGSLLELPIDSSRAGKFLAFDANGKPIAAAGTSANLGPVSSFVNTLLDDSTAAQFRQTLLLDKKGADIASAATIDLDTATGDLVDVTGTTTITTITVAEGVEKTVRFTGILTLTNGASLVLPGAANITTAAGDFAVFRGYASGVVRCVSYQRVSGIPAFMEAAVNGPMLNGTLVASVSGNALTVAIKTRAGTDPSAADPVYIPFRNATAATGDYTIITVSAASSIVVSSTSTLGTASGTEHRLYVVGFNDAGTFRMGIYNPYSTTGPTLVALDDGALYSSTAEGGAGAADSAQVIYTGTAVSAKALRVLGYVESTQATAGTWATTPSKVHILRPGDKRSGDLVQTQITQSGAVATGTTTIPLDDTIPQNTEGTQFMTLAITPTSAINILEWHGSLFFAGSVSSQIMTALFLGATAAAFKTAQEANDAANNVHMCPIMHRMAAGQITSLTGAIRAGLNTAGTVTFNGAAGARLFGGTANSYLRVDEIFV